MNAGGGPGTGMCVGESGSFYAPLGEVTVLKGPIQLHQVQQYEP